MAGGKETPRQKMINLMYLVLTAMLALNVSDSVLNAFKLVRDGLETTNRNFSDKNQVTYAAFEKQMAIPSRQAKVKPFNDKAMDAKKISNDLSKYMEDLKVELIKRGNGIDPKTEDITRRDDQDVSAHYMMGENNNAKARELKAKILEARKKLLNIIDPAQRPNFEKALSLNAVDPKKVDPEAGIPQTWESQNFDGVPLTAAVTLLTKMQADVKNSEAEVIDYLFGQIDADGVTFDKFKAIAVAPTSYLIQGQPYKAQVFLTAFDSHSNPDVSVNGSKLVVKEGMGDYSVSTGRTGIFSWVGAIKVVAKDGTVKEYKTDPQSYQVSAPSAVVSADKMNVLYIGVPNPVSVSAPGVPLEKVRASIGAGSLSGSGGHYTARVVSPGTTRISVSAEIGGKMTNLGTTEYRIKRIPDPIAKFAGTTSGGVSANSVRAQGYVNAILENFDFDAKFQVIKFTMSVRKARALDLFTDVSNSGALTAGMKSAISTVSPRDFVSIDDIYVKGPDGASRKLSTGISIRVQ